MFYLPLLDHHAHPLLSHTLPTQRNVKTNKERPQEGAGTEGTCGEKKFYTF